MESLLGSSFIGFFIIRSFMRRGPFVIHCRFAIVWGLARILSCAVLRVTGMKELRGCSRFFNTVSLGPGGLMKRYCYGLLLVCFGLSIGGAVLGQAPPPQQPLANAAGNWTLYCKDPNGSTSTKYLDLQQRGMVITGHFKGPNQSGGVEGTIDEQHLVVRTKTREVLVFRGRVDGPRVDGVVQGNSFNGTFHDRGGTGSFQGQRSN
jgi:hypothetical protein